ncbi:FecR family protein [Arcobacter cryaerophilus gv. pseudocryaerophilus]|uniref:FecR family protein n=3 Tax=Arcobacteraceae TaxID=2808963 RepID=A0AA96E003_9BACT|nr:FecR family protein [Arcobacter sp. AZ-2023]WNL36208.1 FecR family protein [Arcobacter sp. AZ-2023]WPD11924.1 FecR family protein [Arcobacter sp. DSM 115960]
MKKIILMFLLFVSTLFANIGKITLLEGEAFVKRGEETLRLNLSDQISNNDFIETKTNSKVKITFIDNTIITIGKESSLKIEDYFFDSNNKNSAKTELNVSKGAFHAITGQIGKVNPEKFKLKTKNATIGIRGTEIYGDQNRVFCTQGAIFVLSFGETREVSQGFFVNTFDNQIPSQSTPIDQQQFQDVNSNLNNNNLGNNQNSNSFDNPSSPLAFQNSQNPIMNQNQDNQNSWGDWNQDLQALLDEKNNADLNNSIQNGINSTDNNPAVAITDPSYVQSLIDASNPIPLSFSGTISSTELNPGETIISNSIFLNIYLGGSINPIEGNYNFSTNLRNYNGTFVNSTVDKDGFWASDSSDSSINGKFYGQNISSVSGTINMQDPGVSSLSGTFSATR